MSFTDIVDRSVIEAANERLDAVTARLRDAESGVTAATTAHKTAVTASDLAVRGLGSIDPMTAEHALEGATRALSVATKIHGAATQAHHDARAGIAVAEGIAWAPVALAAIKARIAAAAKADAGRALLAVGEAEFSDATASLNEARARGTGLSAHVVERLDRPVATEAAERGIWASAGFDLEKGSWPWLQQFKKVS